MREVWDSVSCCVSIQVCLYCTDSAFGIIAILKNGTAANQTLSRWWTKIWQYFCMLIIQSIRTSSLTPLAKMQPWIMAKPLRGLTDGCRHTAGTPLLPSSVHTCLKIFFSFHQSVRPVAIRSRSCIKFVAKFVPHFFRTWLSVNLQACHSLCSPLV